MAKIKEPKLPTDYVSDKVRRLYNNRWYKWYYNLSKKAQAKACK